MPDPTTPALQELVEKALTTSSAAVAGSAKAPTNGASREEVAGETPKGGKSFDELVNDLPVPAEVKESVRLAHRGVQSKADRMAHELQKFDGLDEQDIGTLKSLYQDPALVAKFRQVAEAHFKGQSGTTALASAEAAVERKVGKVFDQLLDDPTLDGPSRSALKRLREGVQQEASEALGVLAQRIENMERIMVAEQTTKRSAAVEALQTEMGDDLYAAYRVEAQRLVNAGLPPRQAFQAVMSPEDLAAWHRPTTSKTVAQKKAAAEVKGNAAPAEAGEEPKATGKSMKESRSILEKLLAKNYTKQTGVAL